MPRWRRFIVPAVAFAGVFGLHFVWLSAFPVQDPAQGRWESVPDDASWVASSVSRYVKGQSYWQGYAYAISAGFVWVAVRRFREKRLFGAGKAAVGGATAGSVLAAAACFLSGCCGSPMLAVYLSLFGAAFLPWAKPLVAVLTTAMIMGSYWWMRRKEAQACCGAACACGGEREKEGASASTTGCCP